MSKVYNRPKHKQAPLEPLVSSDTPTLFLTILLLFTLELLKSNLYKQ